MLFSNKAPQNEAPSTNKQSLMGFLFNPRFGRSIQPIGETLGVFVRVIAMIFAANGLFPKNHPALVGVPGARLTMHEIIDTAYHGLRFTREGLPQVLLFAATIGTLVFTTLAAISALLLFSTGSAHAATAVASCSNTGIFDPCGDKDMAYQWLKYLFASGTITDSSGYAVAQTTTTQATLRAALSFFSNAVLILAGIILMYHLLVMVLETAHTGKPMGNANQIWAPIRLVVAIGLLIPVASGGLNVGQAIVVQVAQWGSGLASQTWNKFLITLADQGSSKIFISPTIPPSNIGHAVEDAIFMRACQYRYNYGVYIMSKGGLVDYSTYKINDPGSGTAYSSSKDTAVCGRWAFPALKDSNDKFVADIYTKYKEIGQKLFTGDNYGINAAAAKIAFYGTDGTLDSDTLAAWKAAGATSMTASVSTITPDVVAAAANSVWTDAQTALQSINSSSNIQTATQDIISKWSGDGWVAAGAWFNTIARIQSYLVDASKDAFVQTAPPDLRYMMNKANSTAANGNIKGDLQAAAGYAGGSAASLMTASNAAPMEAVAFALEGFWRDMKNEGAANGSAATTALAGTSGVNNKRLGTIFTVILDEADVMMQKNGAWPKSGNFLFDISTSNPLAELARLGHAFIESGIDMYLVGTGIATGTGVMEGLAGHLKNRLASSAVDVTADVIATLATLEAWLGSLAIGIGLTLGFILPMIPFVHFFFGVLVWLLVVFEAIVSAPLFALAHLNPKGDGLPGGMANGGYFFLLGILLRPVLMIFGLIAAFLLFFITMTFLNKMFLVAAYGTGAYGGFAALSKFIFSIMYAVLAYICANTCFKAIDHFPDSALSWMGAKGPNTSSLGDPASFVGKMEPALAYFGSQGLNKVSGTIIDTSRKAGKREADGARAARNAENTRRSNLPPGTPVPPPGKMERIAPAAAALTTVGLGVGVKNSLFPSKDAGAPGGAISPASPATSGANSPNSPSSQSGTPVSTPNSDKPAGWAGADYKTEKEPNGDKSNSGGRGVDFMPNRDR